LCNKKSLLGKSDLLLLRCYIAYIMIGIPPVAGWQQGLQQKIPT